MAWFADATTMFTTPAPVVRAIRPRQAKPFSQRHEAVNHHAGFRSIVVPEIRIASAEKTGIA
jgi:hypothetical protein